MNLDLRFFPETDVAESRPGESLRGQVQVTFDDDAPASTAVWLRLQWRTAGADIERGTGYETCLVTGPHAAGCVLELPFEVPCPAGPFSVEGTLVSVRWELEARVEGTGRDAPVRQVPVRVVPGPCEEPFLGAGKPGPVSPGFYLPLARQALGVLLGVCAGAVLLAVTVLAWNGWLVGAVCAGAGAVLFALGPGVVFGLPTWRRRFCGPVSVELLSGTELAAGTDVELRVAFTPARDGWLREVATAWLLEEYAHQPRTGEGASRTKVVEALSPYTPFSGAPLQFHARERVSLSFPVRVPEEPSFHGRMNKRQWALLVRVRADRDGEWVYRAPVTVRPPRRAIARPGAVTG